MSSVCIINAINSSLTAMFSMIMTTNSYSELESGMINFIAGIIVIISSIIYAYVNDSLFQLRGIILKTNFFLQFVSLLGFLIIL